MTGDGTAGATIIANVGPYDAWGISVDGTVPLAGKELILPIGVATQVSTQTQFSAMPGYTSHVTSIGATPQWSPNDRVTVRGLFDWQQTRDATTTARALQRRRFPAAADPARLSGPELGPGPEPDGEPGRHRCRATEPDMVAERGCLPFERGQSLELLGPLHAPSNRTDSRSTWSWDIRIKTTRPRPEKYA